MYKPFIAAVGAGLLASALAIAADDSDWYFDDAEQRALAVNEGDLRFLAALPDKPVHHHSNRLEITTETLTSGWVGMQQCHRHIDRVPESQIVYHPERLRDLHITGVQNIGRAWVEGHSVQLRNVGADALLCVSAKARALRSLSEDDWELRNGPFMRRFLDGFYPMRVSFEILFPDTIELVGFTPEAQSGHEVQAQAGRIAMDSRFEGRLVTTFHFRRIR